ncbi:MAG TPA: N4-gp56 family major capsid protein [Burkholderiales bacterium]
MAVPYTGTTALSNLVTAAYDRLIRLQLRSIPTFRQFADTRAEQQTHPGNSVVFQIHQDLAPATTALNEETDPAGVSLANTTQVTVTLLEYGNYTVVTKRLEHFALDSSLDGNIANILAYNQADSVDRLIRVVLDGSTNVIRIIAGVLTPSDGVVTGVTATDAFSGKAARYAVAKMRGNNVIPWNGELYAGVLHPDVAHDLRVEAGPNAWRAPHEYVDPGNLYAGEVGSWEGIRFVENPRTAIGVDGGATGTNIYYSYIFGREALAEVVAEEFHTVLGGRVVDPLDRKTALGWYGIAGWNLFRPQALTVVKSASTIGNNTAGSLSAGDDDGGAKKTTAASKR